MHKFLVIRRLPQTKTEDGRHYIASGLWNRKEYEEAELFVVFLESFRPFKAGCTDCLTLPSRN